MSTTLTNVLAIAALLGLYGLAGTFDVDDEQPAAEAMKVVDTPPDSEPLRLVCLAERGPTAHAAPAPMRHARPVELVAFSPQSDEAGSDATAVLRCFVVTD
jgi:hypothetical protein